MKLRLSLQHPDGDSHDVTLACDVTATVAELARTLISAGYGADPLLPRLAAERLQPVTVLARRATEGAAAGAGTGAAGGAPVLLDPGAAIATSGLQHGWIIEPVAEFVHAASRVREPAGYLEVLSGRQTGALYSLLPGRNLVGRDPTARAYLGDPEVSRRHALLEIAASGEAVLRDLGSVNGTRVVSAASANTTLCGPAEIELGGVALRFTPGPPGAAGSAGAVGPPGAMGSAAGRPEPCALTDRVVHTRSPRVVPEFPASTRELPAPPTPVPPGRIPMLAMLAPMIMGGVMFAVTRSPMSLMMMAFSPVMMIGSWIDAKFGSRRKHRGEGAAFRAALTAERGELEALRAREIKMCGEESPTLEQVARAVEEHSGLLWARRPEHPRFLEVRFGEGSLPSRTILTPPARGDGDAEHWEAVRRLESDFATVHPVPVLERLDRCGAVGVAGDPQFAAGLARSLVLQLAGLHSPEELVVACFADAQRAAEWEWLKWLPHVDTVNSPISAWQLADDEASTTRLLIALEGLIAARSKSSPAGHARFVPAVVVLVLTSAHAVPARLIGLAEDGPPVGVHVIWVARSQAELPAACRTFVALGTGMGAGTGTGERAGGPATGADDSVGQGASEVGFVREGARVPLSRVEHVDTPVAVRLARRLAPVADAAARALDESDLPRAVALREVHAVDLTAGATPILQAWGDTLTAHWVRGAEREPVALAAAVGQGADGPATIDLRLHGPHALVGGTTGAGKSEFLQSWIMSLAANVSPDRLTFLLVDYKGGAAFAECVDLPHTVGLVTDLSPHLVRRALTSLRAELRYREELLAEHGAKDLTTMERRSDPATPPTLVIVVDEFAALASDVPEFVDGVVDVAQRGRSLGLHLILATQRPAGVIKDNLRANTNLRVALRMADEADSSDVIGVKDAAYFDAETPGRGAIKVGPGRITHFQTGYLGGREQEGGADTTLELRSLGFSEGPLWHVAPDSTDSEAAAPKPGAAPTARPRRPEKRPRDIERLRDGIVAAALSAGLRAPRRPWLDALPDRLALETLPGPLPGARSRDRAMGGGVEHGDAVAVGVRDVPEEQAQRPELFDLEHVGNVAIIGSSGTGKTSALIALASALSRGAVDRPIELYGIDAGGGALDAIRSFPTVGAVASLADTELVGRVLERVLAALAARSARFAAARCSGLAAYRATPQGQREPRIVLLIDGFAALRQTAEAIGGPIALLQQLTEIATTGRAAGVHVVVTADRPGALPVALAASVQAQYVLRLASPHDYAYFGVPPDVLEDAPAGRAVLAGVAKRSGSGAAVAPSELQFALAGGEPELHAQTRAVEALGARLRAAGVAELPKVRNAPDRIELSALPVEVRGRPVFGIGTAMAIVDGACDESDAGDASVPAREVGFAAVGLPVAGLAVIAGPSGAGLSTAAATCAAAYVRWARGRNEPARRILLTFARAGLQQAQSESAQSAPVGGWDRIACGEDEVAALARELTLELGGKPPRVMVPVGLLAGVPAAGAVDTGKLDAGKPDAGKVVEETVADQGSLHGSERLVVVVERPAEAEGTVALAELVALAKAARRANALVIFEFEQGAGASVWELLSALKQPTWGLSLQPDEGESQSPFRENLGRVKRANFVPGRGFVIESGRVTPVQVALI
ncbi:FtsK/SpoIIIE domain-containing protein [Leucobacter salsicius]|uniref:FtsK/SpoIIIE domain-containing protein n=1 Tax=Leucobacter salsicius TaxID=664638 RepID=UPI0003448F0B|nr:FtsK/SpoIIIE domain-containing protein [Leucobacter salsicius]